MFIFINIQSWPKCQVIKCTNYLPICLYFIFITFQFWIVVQMHKLSFNLDYIKSSYFTHTVIFGRHVKHIQCPSIKTTVTHFTRSDYTSRCGFIYKKTTPNFITAAFLQIIPNPVGPKSQLPVPKYICQSLTLDSCWPNSSSFCCRGVFSVSVSTISVRILPGNINN